MKVVCIIAILLFLLTGCVHHHNEETVMYNIDGININGVIKTAEVNDIIRHKVSGVRIPCRIEQKNEQFVIIDRLLKSHVLPIIVFDAANNWKDYKKRITVYTDRYKAEVCYEVLNEPLAMEHSPGYFVFKDVTHVVTQMNKYIDYIHSRIGPTSVLSCGIANAATNIERELLLKVMQCGHQDILSIHIYTCDYNKIMDLAHVIKANWAKPVWITEIGTPDNKDVYIKTCGKLVYNAIQPSTMLYYDYNSPTFGIVHSAFWR